MSEDWRIYYDDKPSFGSGDGNPSDAPAWGVQIIVQADPDAGRYIVSNHDFYIYRGGQWFGVDIFGLIDFLTAQGLVKIGRIISNQEFERVYRESQGADIAIKSARLGLEHGERKP